MSIKLVHSSETEVQRYPEPERKFYTVGTGQRKMRVTFYALVIRNRSLTEYYPGGVRAYIEKHRGRTNGDITVDCAMADDFDTEIEDLTRAGLKIDEDWIVFEPNIWEFKIPLPDLDRLIRHINLGVPWLKCKVVNCRVYVWYAGD